jgi:hypothetical protein
MTVDFDGNGWLDQRHVHSHTPGFAPGDRSFDARESAIVNSNQITRPQSVPIRSLCRCDLRNAA